MGTLEIKNLTYRRGLQVLLQDVSFTVEAGQMIALLGENGAGKTTLLRLIAGLNKDPKQSIQVNGSKGVYLKQYVSYSDTLNDFSRFRKLSAIVSFYKIAYKDFNLNRFKQIINFMEIDLKMRLGHISKGTLEKFVIALTLSRETYVYLLDEPLSGIDVFSRDKILRSLLQWIGDESILLVSSHHAKELENIVDSTLILKDQRILSYRKLDDIREEDGLSLEQYYQQIYIEQEEGIDL